MFIRKAFIALACLSVFISCNGEKKQEKPLTAVSVLKVESEFDRSTSRFSAEIKPKSQVNLAFRVSGYVKEIALVRDGGGNSRPLQEGDSIAAGDVLARIKSDDYVNKVNEARSQLSDAKAVLSKSALDLERFSRLYSMQGVSKSEFDNARTANEQAKARVQGSSAALENAETALRDCNLTAPQGGVIIKKNIEVGSLVGPEVVAFVLADVSGLKVMFGIPDVMLPKIKTGDYLDFNTQAVPGVTFRGRVTQVSPAADPSSRVFDVELTITDTDKRLKPGMIASLSIRDSGTSVALVLAPLNAVVKYKDEDKAYGVYAVESANGTEVVKLRRVGLGEIHGNRIEVREGLRQGDRIVVIGATLVRDGEKVRVIP